MGSGPQNLTTPTALADLITNIKSPVKGIVVGIIAILAISAVVYAIYVAFRLAKAEDEGKRKEAKQQLLWSIIAVVGVIALFVVMQFVLPKTGDFKNYYANQGNNPVDKVVNDLVVTIMSLFTLLLDFLTIGAVLLAGGTKGKRYCFDCYSR